MATRSYSQELISLCETKSKHIQNETSEITDLGVFCNIEGYAGAVTL